MRFRVAILLAALCSGLTALAMTLGRGLPDTRIVYSACVPDAEIYIGDWPHRLSFNLSKSPDTGDASPRWSPDGQRIAYQTNRGSDPGIYVYDVLTGETQKLNVGNHFPEQPSWSPDGQSIAFPQVAEKSLIGVVNLSTQEVRAFDVGRVGFRVAWSPDGRWLAYDDNSDNSFVEVMVLNIATGETRNISRQPRVHDTLAFWSPDGSQLVFTSTRTGVWQLYVADMATGLLTNFSNNQSVSHWAPSWSPDGQFIATIANETAVQILDLTGTVIREFDLQHITPPLYAVNWSSYGDYLSVTAGDYLDAAAYLINLSDGALLKLDFPACQGNPIAFPPP